MSSQPTQSLEEGLNHARLSPKHDELTSHNAPPPRSSVPTDKGKTKRLEQDLYDDDEPEEEEDDEDEEDEDITETSYPPTTDEAAETRRVEENLRRWEMAERERRRAVRESVQPGGGGGPSLLGAVTRRASVLLLSNRQAGKAGGLGNHRALNSRDSIDVVPLNNVDQSPRASENPFLHPSERGGASVLPPRSPFDDSPDAVRTSDLPFPRASNSKAPLSQPATPHRTSTLIPPPRPLGLPQPLTPPPQVTSPRVAPMKATPPPTLHPEPLEPEREVRWWHEWLCGCSEGPDRGGEFQAGHTNPCE